MVATPEATISAIRGRRWEEKEPLGLWFWRLNISLIIR
jgi:hypothetical protein